MWERFKSDHNLFRALIARINSKIRGRVNLMEVCGTHTQAISRSGIRWAVDPRLTLLSGPGCPVCVTAQRDLDLAIELARSPGVITATFGDMVRVPGSYSSLERLAAEGKEIRVVYSALDGVKIAQAKPRSSVVLLGVGFETTAPTVAAALLEARSLRLRNFFVLPLFKLIPPALRWIAKAPSSEVEGFILPGHVSVIIGSRPYSFLVEEFKRPCVIAGFEPLDILEGIDALLEQLQTYPKLEIRYRRAVRPDGNTEALKILDQIFKPVDAEWRGLGSIPQSGLGLREEFQEFDATRRFPQEPPPTRKPKGCRCGEVLLGLLTPPQCGLFGHRCTPATPVGPCMVSSEGACAAYYHYGPR